MILVMSYCVMLHHSSGGGLWSARDLFRFVVPMLCYDGEIREVAVTALGMANPQAFGWVWHDYLYCDWLFLIVATYLKSSIS